MNSIQFLPGIFILLESILIFNVQTLSLYLSLQNWQSMHGVSCQTLTPSVFRITRIEGDTFFTIQPKNLSWKARSVNHAILLGRITITIKATPASVGSYSTQVHLDLGFHQFLYLNLELIVKGNRIL